MIRQRIEILRGQTGNLPEFFSNEQRRRRLAWRHRLVPAARTQDPAAIADDLVAVHSSDPVTVFLAMCARQESPSIDSVEAALYEDRWVLRHHAMRRTLWVMTPDIARAAHAACTRRVAANERRRVIGLLDGDEAWLDQAMAEIVDFVTATGPVATRDVGKALPHTARTLVAASGTRHATEISAHTKLLQLGGFAGLLVRARPPRSWIGSQYAWAAMEAWLGTQIDTLGTAEAEVELARRWLHRFGPATFDDVQWWTGWTKTTTRRALTALDAQPVELECGDGFMLPADLEPADDPGSWVALLPGLDPTAMGWKERTWYLDDRTAPRITDRMGNLGPSIWADGSIVGGWCQRADGSIATELTADLGAQHRRLLETEVERLCNTVGSVRFKVRFSSPNQRDLLNG